MLAITGVSLYLVFPSVLTVFDAWPQLGDVRPWWFAVVALLEACSFASLWLLLRIALRTHTWFDVASSQLASNAASRVVPGGAATGSVVQAGMLIKSGHPPGTVGGALGATGLLTTGMLLALPVLAVPAVLTGRRLARQLELGLIVSLVVAVVLVGRRVRRPEMGHAWSERSPARRAGSWRGCSGAAPSSRPRRASSPNATRWQPPSTGAGCGRSPPPRATACSTTPRSSRRCVAVGAHVRPSLVLVAYVAAVALSLVPLTPGGLGFVETGLTSLLVLAGAPTDQALTATLLYRLASYWLPIPIGMLAWAGWRVRPLLTRNRPPAPQ